MSNDAKLEIILAAKDASAAAFGQVNARLREMSTAVFSLKGAIAGLGVGIGFTSIAKSILDTASSFEQLTLKLDTVTKGKGAETLALIQDTVKDLPVDLAKATDAWVMMQAMGLEPGAEKLRTLVDVSSVLGEEALPRVSRALGQMATLGKLSAEELNQLSEVGIDARKYLADAFGKTVEELQKSNISIQEIIKSIWNGLDAQYSGGGQRAMNSWRGMTIEFAKNWQQMERQIAEAGVFDMLKEGLAYVNGEMKSWVENNQNFIRQDLPAYIRAIATEVKFVVGTIKTANTAFNTFLDKAYGIDRRSYQQKLSEEMAANERTLAVFESSNMPGKEAYIEQLRTEIKLQRDKLAILKDQAAAGKQTAAAAAATERYITGGSIGDYGGGARSAAGKAKAGKAAKGIWDEWGVRPYTESEAVLADQKRFEEWKREWSGFDQRPFQESEAVLADQAAFEEWKKSANDSFNYVVELSERTAERMQDNFSDLFFDAFKGEMKSLEDYASAIFTSIQRMMADMAAQAATQAIFGSASVGNTAGGTGLLGWLGGLLSSTAASAKGNIFGPGGLERFAFGGVVSRPTVFPFASGAGLMGEAGPEAIMPLKRMPGGRLGVEAAGGAPVNLTINVQSPDGRMNRESLSQIGYATYSGLRRAWARNA